MVFSVCAVFAMSWLQIVWFQKVSIPSPRRVIGNSEGEGVVNGKNF